MSDSNEPMTASILCFVRERDVSVRFLYVFSLSSSTMTYQCISVTELCDCENKPVYLNAGVIALRVSLTSRLRMLYPIGLVH